MKNALYIIFAAFILASCSGSSDTSQANLPTPKNYVILLDLSDRLLQPNQAANDKAIVKTVFEAFEHTVRTKNMIVNSKDKFRIVIAPQKGTTYDPTHFMNELFIDMEQMPIAQKRNKLDSFRGLLDHTLDELYQKATQNKTQTSDFQGCDLWKYFNEQLETDLLKNHDSQLVILTDGYFDFESNPHIKTSKNRSTATNFIASLRRSSDWKQELNKNDYGLIPIQKSFPATSIIVLEISPKDNSLDEVEILNAIWNKWLSEMGFTKIGLELRSNLSKTKGRIRKLI
jgi:hypothetical protein